MEGRTQLREVPSCNFATNFHESNCVCGCSVLVVWSECRVETGWGTQPTRARWTGQRSGFQPPGNQRRGFRCPRPGRQGTEDGMKLPWAEPADLETGHRTVSAALCGLLRTGTLLSCAEEDRMNELISFNGCTALWAQGGQAANPSQHPERHWPA